MGHTLNGGLDSGDIGDFSNLQGTSVDDILSRIPKDANKRVLTSQPGKVTNINGLQVMGLQ